MLELGGSGDARKILEIDHNLETFPHKMHISACGYYFYILPLDFGMALCSIC